MAFTQLTYRESLRDIETCLRAQSSKLYHMGLQANVSRSTLAEANERRDWGIYADFAQSLIKIARLLYINDRFGVDLDNTVYALDATTIDLCLSVFPWAHFRQTKAAVKLRTLLDLRGNNPVYPDFSRQTARCQCPRYATARSRRILHHGPCLSRLRTSASARIGLAFFIIRAKANLKFRRLYSHPIDKQTGLRYDQTGELTGFYSSRYYPDKLRRIKYHDQETNKNFIFLTNNHSLPALTIAQMDKCRWQVELFFKWIRQHLSIKGFFSTSENTVKTQIWIAVSIYVLVAIVKKRLKCQSSLYTILQILSLTLFERISLNQMLTDCEIDMDTLISSNQLNLFD